MDINMDTSASISVLIISDRLIDKAQQLADYLNSNKIKVLAITTTKEEALKYSDQKFDYLIIVGYLNDEPNYDIIEDLKKQNVSFISVHWAILDALIKFYCNKYFIQLQFDRTLPMSDFVLFLEQNLNQEYS